MYFVPTANKVQTPVPQQGSAPQPAEENKAPRHFYTSALDQFVNNKDGQASSVPDSKQPKPPKHQNFAPGASQVAPPQADPKSQPAPPQKAEVKPDKPQKSDKPDKTQHNKQEDPPADAAKTVGTFKFVWSAVAGFMNSYLFGTPLWVATGLSAAFAATQTLATKKVEREDTPVTKSMMNLSRKVTHTEQDKSAAGKERAVALVWATWAAVLTTVESILNHGYDYFIGKPKKTLTEMIQSTEKKVRQSSSWVKPLHKLKLNGLNFRKELEKGLPKEGISPLKQWVGKAWNYSSRHIQGNKPLAYSLSAISSFIGGYVQIHMAAQIQEGLDKHKSWSNWFKRQGPA